jgi:single-strand DNA-binding protein
MNNFNGIGNLGRDPDIKFFENGNRVANFSIAIRGFKEDETVWIDCQSWNKTADIMADYCRKGTRVGVTGSFKSQKWVDNVTGKERSKLILNVSKLTLLGSKADSQSSSYDDAAF